VVVSATQAGGLAVTAAALATALATGFGAAPLAFATRAPRSWLGPANGVAAVLMLGASGLLFYQGGRSDAAKTVAGAAIGVVTIAPRGALARQARELAFRSVERCPSAHGR